MGAPEPENIRPVCRKTRAYPSETNQAGRHFPTIGERIQSVVTREGG
jgi:hypothetical protein